MALWGQYRRPPPPPPTGYDATRGLREELHSCQRLQVVTHRITHIAALRLCVVSPDDIFTSTPDHKDALFHIPPCRPTCLLSSTALRCHSSSYSPQQLVHNHKRRTQRFKTHSGSSRATTRLHLRPSNHHNHGAGSRASSRQAPSHLGASSLQTVLLRRRQTTMTTLATLKLRNPQAHSLPPRQNRIHGKRWLIVLSPPLHPKTRGGRDSCARQHSTLSPTASST